MMSTWFTSNLGDAMLAGDALAQLEMLFRSTYGGSGENRRAAIFIRHESEGRLHCEVKAYFTPEAAAVARAAAADHCTRPSHHGLSLLAGPASAWQAYFPEHGD